MVTSNDWLFAERALKLDFEPVIDALAVELVSAVQCFYHLTGFKGVNADGTVRLLSFLSVSGAASRWRLFVSKGCIRIYNVSYLLRGKFFFFLLIQLLLKLCEIGGGVVRIETAFVETFVILRLLLIAVTEMLGLLIGLAWHCVESVPVEVHLDVLWIHALNIAHHLRDALEKIWKVGHTSHWLLSTATLGEALKLLMATAEIKLKVLLLLGAISTLRGKMGKIALRWLLRKSLLSVAY